MYNDNDINFVLALYETSLFESCQTKTLLSVGYVQKGKRRYTLGILHSKSRTSALGIAMATP